LCAPTGRCAQRAPMTSISPRNASPKSSSSDEAVTRRRTSAVCWRISYIVRANYDGCMLPQYDEMPVAEAEEKVEQPKLYKVLLHNDDYTTMEFVVEILEAIFNMPEDQAIQV